MSTNYLLYILRNSKTILIADGKVKQDLGSTETAFACTQPDTNSCVEITASCMLQREPIGMNATDVSVRQFSPLFSN